jgi:hypothetical protein
MPGNAVPIFSKSANLGWNTSVLTAANTAMDGTGTVVTVWTADATNGGFLGKIKVRPLGTNTATIMRFFVNNGSTNATPANNSLLDEMGLVGTTLTQIAAIGGGGVLAVNEIFPLGYKINVVLGTAVAAGFAVTSLGGNY